MGYYIQLNEKKNWTTMQNLQHVGSSELVGSVRLMTSQQSEHVHVFHYVLKRCLAKRMFLILYHL